MIALADSHYPLGPSCTRERTAFGPSVATKQVTVLHIVSQPGRLSCRIESQCKYKCTEMPQICRECGS